MRKPIPGAAWRLIRNSDSPDHRPRRSKWRGKIRPAEDPLPCYATERRVRGDPRPHRAILEGGAAFHPELTGRENLRLTGAVYGMDQEEVRRTLDAIVAFADIGPFLDTPVKRYSSGMAVRLALAVAVHLERDVLLVDEILAMGDEAFRTKCIETIRSLSAKGRTVVLGARPHVGLATLPSLLVSGGGRLIDDGPTAEILARYGARARWKAQPPGGEAPPTAASR